MKTTTPRPTAGALLLAKLLGRGRGFRVHLSFYDFQAFLERDAIHRRAVAHELMLERRAAENAQGLQPEGSDAAGPVIESREPDRTKSNTR